MGFIESKTETISKLNELSIFLLAYDEEENIKKSIYNALDAARKNANKYEIIVVIYEGSKDNTLNIVKKLMEEIPNLRLVIQPLNKGGYGSALKLGIKNSRYNHIFYTDADNQFDICEISKLIPYVDNYDIVSGYRKKRSDLFMRIIAAKTYNFLLNILFFVYFKDVDSAFKIYNKNIFEKLNVICDTGMADAEILIKSKKKGLKIKELPVTHYPREVGNGAFDTKGFGVIKPSVVIGLLKDMFRVRMKL